MKPKLLACLVLCVCSGGLRAQSVSNAQLATLARQSIAPSVHLSREHYELSGDRLAAFQSEDEMPPAESWVVDDSARPSLEMSDGGPGVDTFGTLNGRPGLAERRDGRWGDGPEPAFLVRARNLAPPVLDPANGPGAPLSDDQMANSPFVTRSELVMQATQWQESVLARIAADPYTRRYGKRSRARTTPLVVLRHGV